MERRREGARGDRGSKVEIDQGFASVLLYLCVPRMEERGEEGRAALHRLINNNELESDEEKE